MKLANSPHNENHVVGSQVTDVPPDYTENQPTPTMFKDLAAITNREAGAMARAHKNGR